MNDSLADKKILLGISGGIAAYKIAELIRMLKTAGAPIIGLMCGSYFDICTVFHHLAARFIFSFLGWWII